ncbi:hypothetical protein SASPL_101533 [Salvia splendens]|uniref:Uncharacterized protein n=1 Tax=Salvia splendens TaxID=180675 RepID=A0A8X9ADE8_SALSN|nr:hypothetical protein SASPL_101533 [Salvia splendens]
MKQLSKAGEMPSLEPPDDESIRTLYMVLQRVCAFVTYTTREGVEKAAEELANKLVIKGLRMKLLVNDPVAMKQLSKAGEMPSLEPPDDESIRTLYMVLQRVCAFVTYTTREGVEKAAEELANKLVIKGLRMKLLVNDPVAMKQLSKAGEMPSLEPPDDESIRTLYMVLQRVCAFVTYTTREGVEKAAEELANKLVIKGLRMKLLWGRPQE